MSSFELTNQDGRWRVLVNDTDITRMIADGGIRIVTREHPLPPVVELTLMPREFRAQFPAAQLAITEAGVAA